MEEMQHRSEQMPERQGVNRGRERREEGGEEQLFFCCALCLSVKRLCSSVRCCDNSA